MQDEQKNERERIAALGHKLAETYASRSRLDCSFAGPYIEPDAGTKSHCPPDKPCQRCTLERERNEARRDLEQTADQRDAAIAAESRALEERDAARAERDEWRRNYQEMLEQAHTQVERAKQAERERDAAHALLRRLVEANGEQDYGIVAKARKLLGMPESRINPDPDSEHYHE